MAETFNHPGNVASGMYAHAEGRETIASSYYSHAEGHGTTASGHSSHAEGSDTEASGDWSHAEGTDTIASNLASHAEGVGTTASSEYSHAEGYHTTASGLASHAEGVRTTASEPYSHAEGYNTTASGFASHAEGEGTIASGDYQHVQGKYNVEDSNNKYLHIVGNGSNADILKYSNAHTLDWDGNGWFAGKIKVGGTSQDDPNAVEVALKTDIIAPEQSDWNQTDETAKDFIKNKPDEDDAFAFLEEMGLIRPALAADGSAYVDENGAFYSII
jgi:hypothetical protein